MRRRALVAIVSFVVITLAGGETASAAMRAAEKPHPGPNKPNFIVILTDDLDAKSVELMPKIKTLLADRGAVFSNSFVTYSLCCPSRSSLLRGQYPHNHQIWSNFAPTGGFERFHQLGHEKSTLATWLKAAGYRTMLAGKYLNGYPGRQSASYVPPGWDEWDALVGHRAAFFNYRLSENGRSVYYGNAAKDYQSDVLAAKAVEFIGGAAEAKQPFLIYLAPSAPHMPATPAPRHEHAFRNAAAPRTPAFNADTAGKPAWLQKKASLADEEIQDIDRIYRRRLQSMLSIDDMVADIIKALERHGQLDNTYIFFTSDNGFHLGEHRLKSGKATAYEEDIRVPLIVRGPGVARRVVRQIALNIDLAPTLAELAGITAPDFVDGRSLKPLLVGAAPSAASWRSDFLVQYRTHSHRSLPEFDALRTTDHLYVEYATGEKELYDLRNDPYELRNLAGASAPELLSTLSHRISELKHCAGASCRRDSESFL